jgi:hypothetical protein
MALTDYKPVNIFSLPPPFEIKKAGSGISEGADLENSYYVEQGVCFTSFSFFTGSFVPIEGLGSGSYYSFTKDKKFFIDISVYPNLQVSGARIRCETVGPEGDAWKGYPNMIEIQPQDEVDEEGMVTKFINNKTQTNCYVLIGYRFDDAFKNGPTPVKKPRETPVQILDTNIILLASVVSGVPVVFPMPYFNGQAHVDAIIQKTKR